MRGTTASAAARDVWLRLGLLAVIALVGSGIWGLTPPASAVQASQSTLVSAVPAAGTPDINDGVVYAIAQVGGQIILGGTFTKVSPADDSSIVYSLPDTFAFDAATGAINTSGFTPTVNGKVATVIPGPAANEVYIGGSFTTVDGTSMRVALLNTRTGALISSWHPANLNGVVDKLVLADHKLFVGGRFGLANGDAHRGLVALNPTTGRLTSYVDLSFTGQHSYGTQCDPKTAVCANGATGIESLDVNPAGTRMVAIGNFNTVSGQSRDQIAMIDLGKSSATVDRRWSTDAYTSPCFDYSFDSYVRDVQFAPDGSYFVVVGTGGIGTNSDGTNSTCDAAARFETATTGSDVRPTWIDYTGEDTLSSVAITGTTVYVGGHQRWLNNSLGENVAAPGAVPRPGLAALSPASGLPYSWNPGRNPRGAGTFALLATANGLWTGSDTDYIGNETYLRQKIAFFPLTGGESLAAEPTPRLPGRVYLAGATAATAADPDRLAFREFNGKTAGAEIPLATGISWGSVHGAFTVDGQVIYGGSDGNLYERSFDGTTFGPQVELDPYDDPTWDNVKTGSGDTYQGQASTFLSEIPSVTSMFFSRGRLFYTMTGDGDLHWRWFEPESGIVGADEFKVSAGTKIPHVAGAFLAGRRLYFAKPSSGELWSVAWSGHHPTGTPTLVDASRDWASDGMFALSQSTNPTPTPTSAFTVRCGARPTCRFAASPWLDPDGGAVGYRWSFGDGTTTPLRASATVSHRYLANGHYRVTLTVTDTAGATATSHHRATVKAPVAKITFDAASTAAGTGKTSRLPIPRSAHAGDALVLMDSYASTSAKATLPSGWHLVGRTHRRGLTTAVYDKVARRRQPRTATVRYSRTVTSSAILAVYRHTSIKPIERSAVGYGHGTRRHRPPALAHLDDGTLVVGFWTETSNGRTTWHLPRALKRRATVGGPGSVTDGAVVADSGAGQRGSYRLGSVMTGKPARSATQWAVALAPALR